MRIDKVSAWVRGNKALKTGIYLVLVIGAWWMPVFNGADILKDIKGHFYPSEKMVFYGHSDLIVKGFVVMKTETPNESFGYLVNDDSQEFKSNMRYFKPLLRNGRLIECQIPYNHSVSFARHNMYDSRKEDLVWERYQASVWPNWIDVKCDTDITEDKSENGLHIAVNSEERVKYENEAVRLMVPVSKIKLGQVDVYEVIK